MNVVALLVSAAEQCIAQIEYELHHIECQLNVDEQFSVLDVTNSSCLLLEYNIAVAKHSFYLSYSSAMKSGLGQSLPLDSAMSLHLSSLEENLVSSFLGEVSGHQIAISELLNRNLHTHGARSDSLLISVHYFFPYSEVLAFFRDRQFLPSFFKLIQRFVPEKRTHLLAELQNTFKPTGDVMVDLLVAEFVLDLFTLQHRSSLADFEFLERCRLFMLRDFSNLGLDLRLLSSFPARARKRLSLRPYERVSIIDSVDLVGSESEIVVLRHSVLELRKVSSECSCSMKLYRLLKSREYLTSALSAAGGSSTGADESFYFVVYLVVAARIPDVLSGIELLRSTMFPFMAGTKVEFIVQQIASAAEFIQSRALSPPSRMLLPFKSAEDDRPVTLWGFAVFAFREESEVPVLLHYTGNHEDVVVAFTAKFDETFRPGTLRMVQTTKGCFFHIPDEVLVTMERVPPLQVS
jgi:hypothetical protein